MRYILPMEGGCAVLHPAVPEGKAVTIIGHVSTDYNYSTDVLTRQGRNGVQDVCIM